MSNSSIVPTGTTVIKSFDDIERAALAMSKSGFFQDSRDAAQAIVKILAGQEMGFGPFASMTGVYIINGRPSIGANLMAAAVKKSGKYDYRVIEMSDQICSISFYQNGQEIGTSTFTREDAIKAGTKNLDKYARNMLFARAMSNGCRWYCPDIFNGSAVYTPEELGANVNEDGDVIDVSPVIVNRPVTTGEEPPIVERPAPMRRSPETTLPVWPIDDLAQELKLSPRKVQSVLSMSNLTPTATVDDCRAWIMRYKAARDDGKTPQEAAAIANA